MQMMGRAGRVTRLGWYSRTALLAATMGAGSWMPAWAQVSQTISGPPVQVTPFVAEPGVPLITINPGTVGPVQDGSGTGTGGSDSSGTGSTSGSDALNTLLGQSWGATAINEAEALGVNPSAVAATCVIESGCQNINGASGAQGAFQMFPAAYQDGLNTALAANPALASQIVQGSAGMNDPTTEAIAASGYLMQAATALQNAGVSNPTVLDTRGYYNFGPSNAIALANADPSETMTEAMPNESLATLKASGVTPGETVGEWQASVVAKIGNAANQTILS
jgi:hypothetical protein